MKDTISFNPTQLTESEKTKFYNLMKQQLKQRISVCLEVAAYIQPNKYLQPYIIYILRQYVKSPQLIFGEKSDKTAEQVPLPDRKSDILVQDDVHITVVDVVQDELLQYNLIAREEFNKLAEMATLLLSF